jgi:hypothetical protein
MKIPEELSPNFKTFKEPMNRFQGFDSASLCSLAGRYDNPVPSRFLAPIDCLKIPALTNKIFNYHNLPTAIYRYVSTKVILYQTVYYSIMSVNQSLRDHDVYCLHNLSTPTISSDRIHFPILRFLLTLFHRSAS